MIRSHHITAQLAREHQCDLLVAARGARGDRAVHEAVAVDTAAPSAHRGGTFMRHWRGRRAQLHAAAGRGGEPRPAGRCA